MISFTCTELGMRGHQHPLNYARNLAELITQLRRSNERVALEHGVPFLRGAKSSALVGSKAED